MQRESAVIIICALVFSVSVFVFTLPPLLSPACSLNIFSSRARLEAAPVRGGASFATHNFTTQLQLRSDFNFLILFGTTYRYIRLYFTPLSLTVFIHFTHNHGFVLEEEKAFA